MLLFVREGEGEGEVPYEAFGPEWPSPISHFAFWQCRKSGDRGKFSISESVFHYIHLVWDMLINRVERSFSLV